MIGDRVRWAHTFDDPATAEAFKHRGGVVRAATLGPNSQWHVLVQRDDGTYADELASNLQAVEPGSPADVAERDLAEALTELGTELGTERDRTRLLGDYIKSVGLDEPDAPLTDHPCAAAIRLLRTFQAELLAVGTARDAAEARAKEADGLLEAVIAERDAALKVVDSVSKRKRGPGRVSEDA